MGRPKLYCREDVLSDAIQLFWKQGYKDTSLGDLERATGVNKSGLYSEFKDKDDLFVAGIQHYLKTQAIVELLGRKPLGWTNLEDFLLVGTRCERQKGCWVANCIREFPVLPKRARSLIEAHLQTVQAAVENNLRAVSLKISAEDACDLLLTLNSGLALRLNLGPIPGIESRVQEFMNLLRA